jgi:hypothetical protein
LGRFFFSLLAVVFGGSCNRPMIVEAKDVKFFEIAQISTPEGKAVRIRGLVFHSSLAVERIEQEHTATHVVLKVYLTPTRKGLRGDFEVNVPLKGVERILFGPTQERIWPDRSASSPVPKN